MLSIWQGVDRIDQYLTDEVGKCGGTQKYVLVGYSQGALAIPYASPNAPVPQCETGSPPRAC